MSFSFSKWWFSAIAALFISSCSTPSSDWVIATGTSEAGFTVEMPLQNGQQTGTIQIGGEEVQMNISIVVDSGITFVASHFTMPQQLMELDEEIRADQVWQVFLDRANAKKLDEPLPATKGLPSRSGWFINEDDVHMGIVLYVNNDRGIILNSGTPEKVFEQAEKNKMLRYFNSIEFDR